MNTNNHKPRIRIVLTPVSPVAGGDVPAPAYVITCPARRFRVWERRWASRNRDNPALLTPEGSPLFRPHFMTEGYYQAHRPAGRVIHLGYTVARFREQQ